MDKMVLSKTALDLPNEALIDYELGQPKYGYSVMEQRRSGILMAMVILMCRIKNRLVSIIQF